MLSINVKSRLLNKTFWVSLISLIVLLSQEFGVDISTIIPKNYSDIVNTIFAILALLGIVVDTSTPGINDKVVPDLTIQDINKENENGQDILTDASSNDNSTQIIDTVAIEAENQQLKAQLASIINLATTQA